MLIISLLVFTFLHRYEACTPKWTISTACLCDRCDRFENCLQDCHRRLGDQFQTVEFLSGNLKKLQKWEVPPQNLKHIMIKECGVEAVDSDFFEDLQSLEAFSLVDNHVQEVISLNLTACNVVNITFHKDYIEEFPKISSESLRILNVSYNSIRYLKADDLAGMPNIELLDLEGNKLHDIDDFPDKAPMMILYENDFPCRCHILEKIEKLFWKIKLEKDLLCVENHTGTVFLTDSRLLPPFSVKCAGITKNSQKKFATMTSSSDTSIATESSVLIFNDSSRVIISDKMERSKTKVSWVKFIIILCTALFVAVAILISAMLVPMCPRVVIKVQWFSPANFDYKWYGRIEDKV